MDEIIDWNKFKSNAKGKNLDNAKKSYIDFCRLLNEKGHKLLSEYIDTKTKILIDFNCGHEPHWITPNNYKNGVRCPRCVGKGGQAKDDFIDLLNKNNHKLLSEYIDTQTKVLIDFNCGHEPNLISPNMYRRGNRCPKCAKNNPEKARNNFFKILKENGHKLLSEYNKDNNKVLIDYGCEHKPHWIAPNSYKKGTGCPKCSNKSLEHARNRLVELINKNGHELKSEYIGRNNKVLIDFNCGHEPNWILPGSYRKGHGCPKCAKNNPEQAKEDFLKMLEENGHKLESEYINNSTKVNIDYNCGHEPSWITPASYKSGVSCPHCVNKGESALHKLLLELGYKVEYQKTYKDLKYKGLLKYDFYIPKYNLLIELDGEHHRQEVIYTTKYMTDFEKDMAEVDAFLRLEDRKYKDKLKDDYAKNNNIPLLRIEYSRGKIELDKWKQLIGDKIKQINSN